MKSVELKQSITKPISVEDITLLVFESMALKYGNKDGLVT